jgi:hypothetical protein
MFQKYSRALIAMAEKAQSGVKIRNTRSFTGTVNPMAFRLRSKMYRPGMLLEMFGFMDELMFGSMLELIAGLRLLLIR